MQNRTLKYCAILVLMLVWGRFAYCQENRSEVYVDFRVNSAEIDPAYGENSEMLREIARILDGIKADPAVSVLGLSFMGTASPEGSYQLNRRLAGERMDALEKIVLEGIDIPDSLITRDSGYIPWDYLIEMVEKSDLQHKKKVLEILRGDSEIVAYHSGQTIDSRIVELQNLNKGNTWREMNRRFFSRMRNACVVFVTYRREDTQEVVTEPVIIERAEVSEPQTNVIPAAEPQPTSADTLSSKDWCHRLTLKTNLLGLGLAIANAGVEIDICRHLSLSLPVYYSAWDYFREDVKFRTLSIQPELRYWFSKRNDGFYLGGHFGYGWYNVAAAGEFRIQDHDGETPAIGGGLSLGYRVPISRSGRWKLEFSVGGGYYSLSSDYFRNYSNGLLVYSEERGYFGLDQAAVSVSYSFDLRRGGAKKEGGR